jgi:hypothetical protein
VWYDDFNHDTFTFDDASPLAAKLEAIPWPPSYKPPYGGNAAVMAKSFIMAVWNVDQT